MALEMFIGKPRNGKSLGALIAIIAELVYGKRPVVTNLAINFGALNAYLQCKYPHAKVNLDARLRLLTEEETKRYWLVRGPDYLGTSGRVPDSVVSPDGLIDFGKMADGGVFYVIDEAHIHFDARKTFKASPELAFYNSQHGKLGDDIIVITQFAKLVDCRVKDFAQNWHYFTYGMHRRFLTIFRLPPMFQHKVYDHEVKGLTDTADEIHLTRLDLEIAACYDTSAGVGITGRNRPEAKKRGGLPWYFIAVPAAALWALMHYVPDFVTSKLVAMTGSTKESAAAIATSKEPNNLNKSAAIGQPRANFSSEALPRVEPGAVPQVSITAPRLMRGYAVRGGLVNVLLQDGRTFTESDSELGELRRNSVVIDGHKYFLWRPASAVPTRGAGASPVRAEPVAPQEPPPARTTERDEGNSRAQSLVSEAARQQPPTVGQELGSWYTDRDGVQRLRYPETLGRAMNESNYSSPTPLVIRPRTGL